MAKRILVISERYWPEGGGGALATHLIVKHVLRRENGVNITVLTETKNAERLRGVKYVNYDFSGLTKYHTWFNQFRRMNEDSLKKLVANHDIIYITDHSYPLIFLSKKLDKRIIVHLHDYQPLSPSSIIFCTENGNIPSTASVLIKGNYYYELFQQKSRRRAVLSVALSPLCRALSSALYLVDDVICVSKRHAEIISSLMNSIKSKVHVIYNPLPDDVPSSRLSSKIPKFLYVGGDNVFKGILTVISSALKYFRCNRSIKMEFILVDVVKTALEWTRWYRSKYEWEPLLMGLNKALGLKLFNPLPRLNRFELLKLYEESYALLYPTWMEEPLPYSVLEAMLAGRIVIAPSLGGIPELVSGTVGERFLCSVNSVDSFVNKLDVVCNMTKGELEEVGHLQKVQIREKFEKEDIASKIIKSLGLH